MGNASPDLCVELESDASLPRRERERRRRIRDILAAAQGLVLAEGFGKFSMQRLAEVTDYSPAALYTYFACKEEVLTALAIDSNQRRVTLFERIRGFDARPRERMVAMGEVSAVLYPDFFNIELMHYTECVRDRVSGGRRERLRELDRIGYRSAAEIVEGAVGCGDLELPAGIAPQDFVYTLNMLVVGILGGIGMSNPAEDIGVGDLVKLMRRSGSVLMDGFGWRPLSNEWDYRETIRRIYGELFTPVLIHQVKGY